MRVWASIDIRDGAVVQLVGGRPADERIRIPDPAAVARRWLEAGFSHLHVVDLDAALDAGANEAALRAIAEAVRGRAAFQVGGGVREHADVERTLGLGADRVVVGTRAVEDRAWLREAATLWPDILVVAADIRAGSIATRGWTATTDRDAESFVTGLDDLALAGVLVTDVDREGRQAGIDADRFRRLARATRHPLTAAGGITTPADLAALRGAGADGAVLGMALYSGRLDPADALEQETS